VKLPFRAAEPWLFRSFNPVVLPLGNHHVGVRIVVAAVGVLVGVNRERAPNIRGLPDQQARKIGDTQARRTADVAVLVRDIQLVSGLKSHVAIECKTAPWWRLDITTLVITFGLTLTLSVWAYLANMPLDGSELLFVLLVSWVLVVAIRGVWTRFTRAAAGWTS
jgi:hypothetical protein